MRFGEKVRQARIEKDMTQAELAKAVGVSLRTVLNYENENRYPNRREVYGRLAEVLDVPVNHLLTEDEEFVTAAAEKYGSSGERDAKAVLTKAAAVFAGGELSDDDRLAFMTEIQQLYLESKDIAAKKFTPKKYRKKESR